MRTQVGIVGAGPAGLLLSHLLHRAGIASVVLEIHSRAEIQSVLRAAVLEQGTVDLLCHSGVGERLRREGTVHHGINLRFERGTHRIDFAALTGKAITLYPQHEVIKDLVAGRLAAGGDLRFEVSKVTLHELDGAQPKVRYHDDADRPQELVCDFVAGCDGFHGVSRPSIPEGARAEHVRDYPFGWLGILVEAPPATRELIYARHRRGFALVSTRSPQIQRLYLQCDPHDAAAHWPDERIWSELHARLETDDDWRLHQGPIVQKGVIAMRSFVTEPMRYRQLFLAGDAAHIVPPTGAKGLNLAVADVELLARALADAYRGDERGLDGYSATALRRVWRAQHFAGRMTAMLHRFPDQDGFQHRLQLAELAELVSSPAAATALAEGYVGVYRE